MYYSEKKITVERKNTMTSSLKEPLLTFTDTRLIRSLKRKIRFERDNDKFVSCLINFEIFIKNYNSRQLKFLFVTGFIISLYYPVIQKNLFVRANYFPDLVFYFYLIFSFFSIFSYLVIQECSNEKSYIEL